MLHGSVSVRATEKEKTNIHSVRLFSIIFSVLVLISALTKGGGSNKKGRRQSCGDLWEKFKGSIEVRFRGHVTLVNVDLKPDINSCEIRYTIC